MEFEKGSVLSAPSPSRVEWFERAYDVRLPGAFRRLLATGNGGVPKRRAFLQGAQQRLVERFLPLLDDPGNEGDVGWYDISVVISQIEDRMIADDRMVGTDVVPIAALFGGDFLCLSFRDALAGEPTVVVWDHELSEEGAPHLVAIAKTLDEFFAQLK